MKKQQEECAFSARSMASLRREEELRQQLARVEGQIGSAERELRENEALRDSCKNNLKRNGSDGWVMRSLDGALANIKTHTLRLELLREMKADLEANIEAECASPPDRAGLQAKLRELARQRLEQDGQLENQLAGLRDALARREALTREMRGLGERIEFTGDLDEQRFARLLSALTPILPESDRWFSRFIGEAGDGLVRAVARVRLELPETLHHAGRFQPGDEVLLTPEEYEALSVSLFSLAIDDVVFVDKVRDYFTPRQVVSVDQLADDREAAKAAKLSLVDFWRRQDEEEFQAAQRKRATEYQRRQWDNAVEDRRRMNGGNQEQAQREVERQYGPRP